MSYNQLGQSGIYEHSLSGSEEEEEEEDKLENEIESLRISNFTSMPFDNDE